VLRDKYGDSISGFPLEEGTRWPRFSSGWWKELMSLEGREGANWFSNRVVRKVASGKETCFWKDSGVFWNLTWRRHPFLWEHNLIGNLLDILQTPILGEDADKWRWLP